jgi:hypothetical protein
MNLCIIVCSHIGKEIPQEILDHELRAKNLSVPHVSFYDPLYDKHINENEKKKDLNFFFRILSICHDDIPENIDGVIRISASNPDSEVMFRIIGNVFDVAVITVIGLESVTFFMIITIVIVVTISSLSLSLSLLLLSLSSLVSL